MKRGFEEKFVEVQSGLISLCLEAVDVEMDYIYAYGFVGEGTSMFNLFYGKQGKIIFANQVVEKDILRQVLKIGTADVDSLRKLCADYEAECPKEMKMVYDCRTKKFNAEFRYKFDDDSVADINPVGLFMEWRTQLKDGAIG